MIDRRLLLTGLAATPLMACAPLPASLPAPGATHAEQQLKLVTFNIWHNQGDWPARLALLIADLRAQDADVIALQEVLEDAVVGLPNQAQTIADALGGYEMHFVSTDAEGAPRRYGNAILSRLPVLQHDWKKLEPLDDYRTAIRARVTLGGRPVDIVNTHLAAQPDAGAVRTRQISDLMAWLPQDGTPLIVTGDFNAQQTDPELATLTGPRLLTALPHGAVVTTLNPAKNHLNRQIDHIFAEREHFTISQATRIGDQPTNGEYPSDHFGVAAVISLR